MHRRRSTIFLNEGSSVSVSASGVDRTITDTRVCGPMRNQPPLHEPALVAALVTDNHGNVGRRLRGDIEAWGVLRQIAVEVPANPNVTELEGSGEAATY